MKQFCSQIRIDFYANGPRFTAINLHFHLQMRKTRRTCPANFLPSSSRAAVFAWSRIKNFDRNLQERLYLITALAWKKASGGRMDECAAQPIKRELKEECRKNEFLCFWQELNALEILTTLKGHSWVIRGTRDAYYLCSGVTTLPRPRNTRLITLFLKVPLRPW